MLLTSKRRTCMWVSDDEFYQVHEYFEILISVRRRQQLSRLVRNKWENLLRGFVRTFYMLCLKKILKMYSTKGKIWVAASIIPYCLFKTKNLKKFMKQLYLALL